MKEFQLNGKVRETFGKKETKMLRKEGLVPCNIYGEKKNADGLPEAIAFTIPANELRKVIYTPHVYVCNINIEGTNHVAIIKELQFHPVTDALLHVDFYEVNETKPITIGIPVKLNGLAQGVRDGGRLALQIRKINVTAPYKQIPEILEIDVTNLGLGKSIKVGELSFEGLELATSKDVVVCTVKMTRAARSAAGATTESAE
ncbi:MAG: 50S ribosomal protein L25/general stress protein Ctc [Prevotella sp.]|jgi:large subunit ribosomal protein L25|nr:50S ribosomal protein L25/general stress protein Ctc [Prevotella sp.]